MIIVKPHYEIEPIDGLEILQRIEKAGRTCYKSEDNITPDSATSFIRGILKRGHESVIEHEKVSVRIICDRGVTHELVRHRLASYSQESTRYCDYGKEEHGVTFIIPPWVTLWEGFKLYEPFSIYYTGMNGLSINGHPETIRDPGSLIWLVAMYHAERLYLSLRDKDIGWKPEEARNVLPIGLKTEIVITANLREWRHIFKMRAVGITGKPHPQMREIMIPMLHDFKMLIPVIFDDIEVK